jgi:hypothetical protein
LSGLELEEAQWTLAVIGLAEKRIEQVGAKMAEEQEGDRAIDLLQTVPGVGPIVSLAYVSYIEYEARGFSGGRNGAAQNPA